MSSLNRRLEKLEEKTNFSKDKPILLTEEYDSDDPASIEQAIQRHLEKHPEDQGCCFLILD